MKTLKVLIVDDEPLMRSGVIRVLKNFIVQLHELNHTAGFEFIEAETGEDGILKVESESPDIMLLDMKLPGIQGLEVLETVSSKKRDCVVIMITAHASIGMAVSTTKLGAFDFLAKPFTPNELKTTIEKAANYLIVQRHVRELERDKRQLRFQLISVVAHELKSPIAAIETYLKMIDDGMVKDEQQLKHVVERSIIRIQGMRKLIFDLLDMTSIEAGTKKRELVELDVIELARSAIDAVETEAMVNGVKVELVDNGPVPMIADRREIEIILNNLVSNAVKYNRKDGKVSVCLEREKDTIRITVSDTGIGMTPDEMAKLFEDFVRIKNQKTLRILGSGLGLSTVKKISHQYQGNVEVKSIPDQGSTFTVVLTSGKPREQ